MSSSYRPDCSRRHSVRTPADCSPRFCVTLLLLPLWSSHVLTVPFGAVTPMSERSHRTHPGTMVGTVIGAVIAAADDDVASCNELLERWQALTTTARTSTKARAADPRGMTLTKLPDLSELTGSPLSPRDRWRKCPTMVGFYQVLAIGVRCLALHVNRIRALRPSTSRHKGVPGCPSRFRRPLCPERNLRPITFLPVMSKRPLSLFMQAHDGRNRGFHRTSQLLPVVAKNRCGSHAALE